MGGIIQIQVGQCGNRIGSNFWNTISEEHGLNADGQFAGYSENSQLERINTYYEETKNQVYMPRAVLVDTDPTALTAVGAGVRPCDRNAFRAENFVTGHGGTGGNWSRGYYAADDLPARVMEAVRSETERCDRVQGVQIVHSLGGGTGAGLGTRVAESVRLALPNRAVNAYGVVPSSAVPGAAATAYETYNATLSVARLVDSAHMVYMADNRALYDACTGPLAISAPAYSDLNHLIAQTMSGVTTAMRFASAGGAETDTDMRKRAAQLVPYARMHFFVPGFAPITHRGQTRPSVRCPVPELAAGLFAAVSRCGGAPSAADQRRPLITAAACTFRGTGRLNPVEVLAVQRAAAAAADGNGWLPDNVSASGYDVRSRGLPVSGTVVANTTAVGDVFHKLIRRYASVLAKKEFMHLYTDEGMTISDFQNAREQIESLLVEYRSLEENHDDADLESRLNESTVCCRTD